MYETSVTVNEILTLNGCGSCGRRGAHALITRLTQRCGDCKANSYGQRIGLEGVAATVPAPRHAAALDEMSSEVNLVNLEKALGVREEGCYTRF